MSTKPWEESWARDEESVSLGDFAGVDPDGFCVVTAYANEDDARCDARLSLACAAPDMARALLALTRSDQFASEFPEVFRTMVLAALTKAGVIPAAPQASPLA